MTEKELRKIYQSACDAKGFEPSAGQFKIWKLTLAWSEESDLEAAVADWFAVNPAFPMPAELRPLIEAARRERIAKTSQPQVQTVWECMDCHTTISTFDMDYRPSGCKGVRAVPKRDVDYGAKCDGREFKIRFRFDATEHAKEKARW